jgi:NAD+ diphosphatase
MEFMRNAGFLIAEGATVYVVGVNDRRVLIPDGQFPVETYGSGLAQDAIPLGELDGVPIVAVSRSIETSDQIEEPGWLGLRDMLQLGDNAVIEASILAVQRLEFRDWTRFCSRCASAMEQLSDTGRKCSGCGHVMYPLVTPAVLVLIEDDDRRTLLAQKDGWGNRYSVIAGFVEPGESLEQCCVREALEEVGVTVSDVRYVGSQPWPFPHQLMVAFRVRWVSGVIKRDQVELADARWFSLDALPELPPRIALSRTLIQHWIDHPSYP